MESLCGFEPDQREAIFGGLRLGDADALLIAADLEFNGVMTSLDISANYISDEGAKALASALRVNGVLKSIDLRFNDLGDEGKGAIRDAVSGRVGFELEM